MATFEDKLKEFLEANKKTEDDVKNILKPQDAVPPEVKKMVVEHVITDREKPSTVGRRKLRLFSGKKPVPAGEVSFATWRIQVQQLIDESEVADAEKRRCIVDSLLMPALNLVRNLPLMTTSQELLSKISKVYGLTKSAEEMMFDFFEMYQAQNEIASDYLTRLYTELTNIGDAALRPVRIDEQNESMLTQFIRGCWDDDLIHRLKLEEMHDKNLYYDDLFEKIKKDELRRDQKKKRMHIALKRSSVKTQQYQQQSALSPDQVNEQYQLKPSDEVATRLTSLEINMKTLSEQIEVLSKQIGASRSLQIGNDSTQRKTDDTTSGDVKSKQDSTPVKKSSLLRFCYNCGEDNHHCQRCKNNSNPELVHKKLMMRSQPQEKTNTSSTDSSSDLHKSVPPGLIGDRPEGFVFLNDVECPCLIDTGAQVTTVTDAFHRKHLLHLPIHPLTDVLTTEGAGGQRVPYTGYLLVDVRFPEEIDPAKRCFSTPILIATETSYSEKIPMIVGTNVLHKLNFVPRLFQQSRGNPVVGDLRHTFVTAYRSVTVPTKYGDGLLANVSPLHKITIPAGGVENVSIKTNVGPLYKPMDVLIQPSEKMPTNLKVPDGVMKMSQSGRISVPVMNTSSQPITISKRTTVAEIHVPEKIKPLTNVNIPPVDHIADVEIGPVPDVWEKRITSLLHEYKHVFAKDDLDLGCTDAVKHRILLNDVSPFKERSRPISPADFEDLREHLKELLEAGIIKESHSPYASPIVIVRKKTGKIRMTVDYRKLNQRTVKDSFNLPKIEDILTYLSGSRWFSTLDLKSGYYQVQMHESDTEKTAFICPLGFFEFNRLPQGVTNAPATFQRLMERCMSDMTRRDCMVFLDDLIIYSDTLESHELKLRKVFDQLAAYNLKLSPQKCKLFQTEVRYLGHSISQDGISTDPDKISALKSWPVPRNSKELHSFLGFTSFYRKYVEHYSRVVQPLQDLLQWCSARCGNAKKRKIDVQQQWTEEHQQAFQAIIEKLTSAPVLGYANYKLPYVLHTDASRQGLGAILYQNQGEHRRVIAYASRRLSKTEKNYPAHKLEFLAMKWAITDKFKDYLYNSPFKVMTDNNPLTYVLTSAKLDATSSRWIAALASYNFSIHYKAGHTNRDADLMSRRPLGTDSQSEDGSQLADMLDRLHVQKSTVINFATIATNHTYQKDEQISLAETVSHSPDVIPPMFENPVSLHVAQMSESDWEVHQHKDTNINHVMESLRTGKKPQRSLLQQLSSELRTLYRSWDKFELRNGVLYRKILLREEPHYQLVLPESHRAQAFDGLHSKAGHPGVDRTVDFIHQRYYYPNMMKDIQDRIRSCERCVRRKALPQHAAGMHHLQSRGPMDLICIDFLSLEPDSSGYENILVVTDHFTKYAQAFPTRNQKTSTVAKILWENVFIHYGFCRVLHSDQGRDFEAKLIKELCKMTNIKKTHCSPYHPLGNSQVERFNRTLLNMLGTLSEDQKRSWRKYVPELVHAYNCSRHDSTGVSPFYMMFGRNARLPVDIAMGVNPDQYVHDDHHVYVRDMRKRLEYAYDRATQQADRNRDRSKTRYDANVTESFLNKGDRVLVRNVGIRGKKKIADRWTKEVYIVQDQLDPDLPVYKVYPEGNQRKLRTLHRDLLLPCNFLPVQGNQRELQKKQKFHGKHTHRRDGVQLRHSQNDTHYTDEQIEILKLNDSQIHGNVESTESSGSQQDEQENHDSETGSASSREMPRRSARTRRPVDRLQYTSRGIQQNACQVQTEGGPTELFMDRM